MFLSVALLSILPLVTAAPYGPNATDLHTLFGPSLSPEAEIFLPSYANYTQELQQRWTEWSEPSYIGAIKVGNAEDVQNIVRIASAHKIPFLATAAGHGASLTFRAVRDGIDIDLSNLRYARLDAQRNLVTIGGATKFEQIWDILQPAGKEIPTGSAPCVGSLGATLGGGIGYLQGLRGLTLDSLESVRLVTATGDLITVSKSENADLFWGIRGAGFNFGIVTEATYRVYDTTFNGQVMEGDLLFSANASRSIWEIINSYDNTLPAELSLSAVVTFDATIGQPRIILNAVYYGPMERGRSYLQPFFDLNPIRSNVTMVAWNRLSNALYFGAPSTACLENLYLNVAGQGLKQTDVATYESFFADFTNFYRQHPQIRGSFVSQRFPNQAVLSVPDDETAYPYRDIKTHLLFQNIYPRDAGLDGAVEAFLTSARAKFQQTSGFRDFVTYSNYGHGDEGPQAWYSPRKLGRLSSLKRRWDPDQLFSFYNPIPLR